MSRTGDKGGKLVSSSGGGGIGWGVDMVGGNGIGAEPRMRRGSEVVRNKRWLK